MASQVPVTSELGRHTETGGRTLKSSSVLKAAAS
jgi:hypothetical protein